MLKIVGSCDQRFFGMEPAERLRRQRARSESDAVLVASASAVLGDTAVAWLLNNRGTGLLTDSGRLVAVAVDPADIDRAEKSIEQGNGGIDGVEASAVGDAFSRKLRRRDTLFVASLDDQPRAIVEKRLFRCVYKGVTDLVTKYVWPFPAYLVTKVCARARISPNAVTLTGMAAMIAATLLWLRGDLLAGLAFAWLMTFLDTVDGKLARVTVTSSPLGNKLDHVTDIIHPPIWWAALAYALIERPEHLNDALLWNAAVVILAGYVVGRIVEAHAKKMFGFNPFLWRPFDSAFRLVVSRRNIVLLFMTAGLLLDVPDSAFVAAAAWTFISVLIQLVRVVQAYFESRRRPLTSWLI